jgi:hypothetical protein
MLSKFEKFVKQKIMFIIDSYDSWNKTLFEKKGQKDTCSYFRSSYRQAKFHLRSRGPTSLSICTMKPQILVGICLGLKQKFMYCKSM